MMHNICTDNVPPTDGISHVQLGIAQQAERPLPLGLNRTNFGAIIERNADLQQE